MQPYSPRLPWIQVAPHPRGGFIVRDTRTGQEVYAGSAHAVAAAAAGMSSAPGYHGLGDAVAGVARRLGFSGSGPGCTPCAQRQAALNGFFPKLWRR